MHLTRPQFVMSGSPSKRKHAPHRRDLALVDVAGQLGQVLDLFVFRQEGAAAAAVLVGWDHLAKCLLNTCG